MTEKEWFEKGFKKGVEFCVAHLEKGAEQLQEQGDLELGGPQRAQWTGLVLNAKAKILAELAEKLSKASAPTLPGPDS